MESDIIKIASTQGIGAVIAIILIFYILKTQEKRDERQEERENNYQDIIFKLTEKFSIVDTIRNDVDKIKSHILKE